MPFKLKLKKSRHYSVASKSLFVISVEMLDATNVECTLSSESTGQDCLDVVCQKLGLNQPKFFGLQYMSLTSEGNLYWLELDKPIKRQLDKYARGLYVYLRVMYYIISGVRLINDEVTRYHYFLQLKMDVIEGKISCTPQQAVELASYSMQAEFGNFDAERHTSHYLKDFQLFPKSFTDALLLDSLTEAASRQHAALHNLPQGTAEEYYICACQQLEGYGQEIYAVRDRIGDDAIISVSLTEVSVGYAGEREGQHYAWTDIKNVINHKKDFTIETIDSEKVDFQFADIESAKNAWRFCVLQHTFYRQYEMNNDQQSATAANSQAAPIFQQAAASDKITLHQMDSYEDITEASSQHPLHQWHSAAAVSTHQHQQMLLNKQRAQSISCLDLNKQGNMDQLRSLLPSYRPAPDYETAIQHKYRNSSGAIPAQREALRNTHTILYSSQPEIHQGDSSYATHLRYPDVTHNNIEAKNILAGARLYNNAGFTQSQLLEPTLHMYKPPPPYPTNRISSNSTPDLAGIAPGKSQHQFISNLVSGSSPDLVSGGNFYLKQQQHLNNLAIYQHHNQSVHPVHRSHSYLPPQHGTYENLSTFINNNMLNRPQQALIVDDPNITKHIKKVYDQHGNIIYCMPANVKQILEENPHQMPGFVLTSHESGANHLNSSTEPIYENIPLPWQNNNNDELGEMRARTQSIHSAPEISQVVNHTVVNQFQHLNLAERNSNSTSSNNNGSIINKEETLYANIRKSSEKLPQQVQQPHETNRATTSEVLRRSQQNLVAATNTAMNLSVASTVAPLANSSMTNSIATESNVTTNSPSSFSSSMKNSMSSSSGFSNSMLYNDESSSGSVASSNKSKKKRWGMLIGRSKSNEKVKSATLGREKEKKEKSQSNNKHRWSTGLPRGNPLPPAITKEELCHLFENKLADSQLFFEFDSIPKKKQNANFSTASHKDNAQLNRFKDVLPYEDNLFRLTPTKNNKMGYINASHITATVGSKQRFYIAAQGPNRLTLSHFWQCVWEAEVYLIVQLTDTTEDLNYMPDSNERCIDISPDYQVFWEFSQNSGNCITSKVRLCHVPSRRYRTLWHMHYTNWDDQGCPQSVGHFLGFLEEMQSVHQHSMGEIPPGHNKNPPIMVHCTAGVGRTGLAILSDLLLYTVDHNQEVCVPRVVEHLRHQRAYMVQTIAQYRFVYSLLIYYLKQTRLI